ncbi:hypothetical protein QBC33DRAFT_551774 [Phialemonium atrogriseum]|uniref:Secreted protein n=1 Tax=Phialemonium atrogriseum TaxID=1093897 RepID=A0AAJ0BQR8_9PEZI|nr:uncharacterized protein QBC33DRAFT_551774 [Phialemonium atrogriseum]KAK1762541.1 hypothetical protein QBC33DRAFT_551774 [Phialemonium atrogriseum]
MRIWNPSVSALFVGWPMVCAEQVPTGREIFNIDLRSGLPRGSPGDQNLGPCICIVPSTGCRRGPRFADLRECCWCS